MDWALKLKFPRKHPNIAFLISHYSCNTCWAFLASPVTNSTCGFHGGCLGGSWQRGTASQLALAQTREGAAHHPGRHDDPWPVTTTFLTGPSVTTRSHSPPAMPDSGPRHLLITGEIEPGCLKRPGLRLPGARLMVLLVSAGDRMVDPTH